jgi:lipoprotein-releasing system permease protein
MLSLAIATRFIRHNRNQSILIVLGIAIGITAQLFVGMLIDSLQASLINQTLGTSPHITLRTAEGSFADDAKLRAQLSALGEVETVLPVASANAFLVRDGRDAPVLFRGVGEVASTDLYRLSERLVTGQLPATATEVLVGTDLAERMELVVGDGFTVQNPRGEQFAVQVSGIFDLKVQALNQTWLFGSVETGQQIGGYGDGLTAIELQVRDPFAADKIMTEQLQPIITEEAGITLTNWKEQNASLLAGLQGQSSSSYMIQLFVLLSVLVGITSVLSISVLQQSRQLGILKAMGLQDGRAGHIFAWQGAILGFLGVVIGAVLGFAAFYGFALNVTNPDGTPLVAPAVDWPVVVLTLVIAYAVAVLAGILPARRSRKLSPIDVIRGS